MKIIMQEDMTQQKPFWFTMPGTTYVSRNVTMNQAKLMIRIFKDLGFKVVNHIGVNL